MYVDDVPMRGDVTVEQQTEQVFSNLPEPDPRWRYTDSNGHEHYRAERDWPTLEWVVDHTYWCGDCRDEHDEGHYACRMCGEPVEPGTRPPSPYGVFVTTGMSATATVDAYLPFGKHVTVRVLNYTASGKVVESSSERSIINLNGPFIETAPR